MKFDKEHTRRKKGSGKTTYVCQECGIDIVGFKCKPVKFCSLDCRNKNYKKRPAPFKGKSHTQETKNKVSAINKKQNKIPPSRKGATPWNKGIEIFYNRGENHNMRDPDIRRRVSESQKGEKSHLWKGGISKVNKRIRAGVEFKMWREEVFSRDNYTCVKCGATNTTIHPHHIKPFATFVNDRFNINNGETLCVECHQKEHRAIKLSCV